MHAASIVARVLGPCLHDLHLKRAAACQRAVVVVVLGAALSLSGIALWVRAASGYRHRVKSVDRLLRNAALHAVRAELYAALAARWLTGVRQLLLVIDWSDLTPNQHWHWLRASVAVECRSVTLYEEVHPQQRLGNPRVHRQFLARVADLLPPGCEPIVMTDAGFHSTWFRAVSARGWAFIGRTAAATWCGVVQAPGCGVRRSTSRPTNRHVTWGRMPMCAATRSRSGWCW